MLSKFTIAFVILAIWIDSSQGDSTPSKSDSASEPVSVAGSAVGRQGKSSDSSSGRMISSPSFQTLHPSSQSAQSRDTGYGGGSSYSPISTGYSPPSPSYAPPPVSNYAAPAAAYEAPSYDTYYEEDDDYEHKKKKKIALAIALPIAIPLGVLGIAGVAAALLFFLTTLRALFTLGLLRGLCTNTTLSTSNLCTLVNSITITGSRDGKEAGESAGRALGQYLTPENIGQLITFLHDKFTSMDHLENVSN